MKKIILILFLLAAIGLSFWLEKNPRPLLGQISEQLPVKHEMQAFSETDVLSLLKVFVEEKDLNIETKDYESLGVLVESIGNLKNGQENKYWQYWVNGKLGEVSADKRQVLKGDKVEWIFDYAYESE